MKELPLGIQNFPEIINRNLLYVDKTALAHELVTKGKHHFLSRPRRFGKSLFLNTLKEIFLGNKELFKGLTIEKSDYSWEKYPVLYFDFSGMSMESPDDFRHSLVFDMNIMAKENDVEVEKASPATMLKDLVLKVAKKRPVVVLIDEYDKAILDFIKKPEIVEENRTILRSFFSTLKSLDAHLRFTFTTGISRFSRASLFSGFNNLTDISFDEDYTAIAGYTEEEIDTNFKEHIAHCASLHQTDEKSIRGLMKNWYNGYRFSQNPLRVYNPFSTLHFLNKGKAQNYWYSSGTPTFLIHQIEKFPRPVTTLEGLKLPQESLSEISDINNINLPSLMFQAGYLTIQSYSKDNDNYTLEFPNEEVRKSFFKSLLIFFSGTSEAFDRVVEVKKAFQEDNIPLFIEAVNAHLLNLCYDFFDKAQEKFFHGILVSILELCMIKTSSEQHTLTGRIDLLIEREKVIYIVEFKLDKSAKEAMDQIKEKRYLDGFFNRGKKVVAVGLNFDSKKRQITEHLIEDYSEDGKPLKA